MSGLPRVSGRECITALELKGFRLAVVKDKPIDPGPVETYLQSKFGDSFEAVRKAMVELAKAFKPDELAKIAFQLYEKFRPEIEPGRRGWGQKGELSLDRIKGLAK